MKYFLVPYLIVVFSVIVIGLSSESTPDWIVTKSDSICGLTNPRQITNPGVINYYKVYNATDSIKELTKKHIDPESVKGSQLIASAKEEIRIACVTVMRNKGVDSIWKHIANRKNGIKALELTKEVTKEL